MYSNSKHTARNIAIIVTLITILTALLYIGINWFYLLLLFVWSTIIIFFMFYIDSFLKKSYTQYNEYNTPIYFFARLLLMCFALFFTLMSLIIAGYNPYKTIWTATIITLTVIIISATAIIITCLLKLLNEYIKKP